MRGSECRYGVRTLWLRPLRNYTRYATRDSGYRNVVMHDSNGCHFQNLVPTLTSALNSADAVTILDRGQRKVTGPQPSPPLSASQRCQARYNVIPQNLSRGHWLLQRCPMLSQRHGLVQLGCTNTVRWRCHLSRNCLSAFHWS